MYFTLKCKVHHRNIDAINIMPRVRQHRTSKANAIQLKFLIRQNDKFLNVKNLEEVQKTFKNVHNFRDDINRQSFKHDASFSRYTYKQLCDNYINRYVWTTTHYMQSESQVDIPNIKGYGIIMGFELKSNDKIIPIDDEMFSNGHKTYMFDDECSLLGLGYILKRAKLNLIIYDIFDPKLRLGSIRLNMINHFLIKPHSPSAIQLPRYINYYYDSMLSEKVDDTKTFETNTCGICLDEMVEIKKNIILPCGHKFHKCCIDTWKTHSIVCPYCKTLMLMNNSSFVSLLPKIYSHILSNKKGYFPPKR